MEKLFRGESKGLQKRSRATLEKYLKNIYDTAHVAETLESLHKCWGGGDFKEACRVLQVFLVSDAERKGVRAVQRKLAQSLALEKEMESLSKALERDCMSRKEGIVERKMEFETRLHDDKLEKAHQRLNLAETTNRNLREQIDFLRKEKAVAQRVFE